MLINGHRLQRKYVAFLAIVPLLFTTALIKVDCPIDGGTGMVTSAPGIENVSIVNTESQWKANSRDLNACSAYIMFLYDIKLGVVNKGLDDTWGYVKLVLVDLMEGDVVGTQYVVLEVPGGTSADVSYTIWFNSQTDRVMLRSVVVAELIVDDVPDITCKGTGKIPLNSWPIVNGLKGTFGELGRQQVYYPAPPVFDPFTEQTN